MQAKAGLILENDGFIEFEVAQFFLTPRENVGHLWPEPAGKHNRPASDCNLSDATNIVPAALLESLQSASLDVPPASVHPRKISEGQIPGEAFLDRALTFASRMPLVELGGQVWVPVSELGFLLDSLH
jgi:hypothetical protein